MNSRISWIIIITFILAPLFHSAHAQEQEELNVTEIVLGHIGDSYEWHITDIGEKEIAIALPVIVYSKTTGWHCFSSSKLHHGAEYEGLSIATEGDLKGKIVNRADFKDKYLLLYFWASWDENCRKSHTDLRSLYKKKAYKKDLALLGISLDVDKERWKEAIERDTLEWEQVCDFQGWNSESVKQYGIRELPTTYLLTPTGRIEGKNLSIAEIEEKLKNITKK